MINDKGLTGEGERRQATIMFADLSGFTSMSEKMDPEELRGIVGECLHIMGRVVESYEGTIDKFIGDCVMAVFGVPVSIENAPGKAIQAAIDIRSKIAQFIRTNVIRYPIDIHIGINTGIVVSGPVGTGEHMDYTVMGDAVNIASRLKDISEAGQIYVGQNTYRQTRDAYEFKSLEPVMIRGKSEPLNIYELIREKESRKDPALFRDRMVYSTLVGRQKEMDKLSLQLLKLVNGEGSIVSIIGEAGVGKSRLMAEIMARPEIDRILSLEGRAISSGKNLSFYPIIEILSKWADIREEDLDQVKKDKLERKIRVVAGSEVNEIFPFIATFMGLSLDENHGQRLQGIEGPALEKLIIRNLDALLVGMASVQPLMIVMEDLHWADVSSVELIESICRHSSHHPILFVHVFRPGYADTSERIQKTIRTRYPESYTEIVLEPLGAGACEEMIHNLIKARGFPADVKEQIIRRTNGNPFFIEEIIRSFIDDGSIELKHNQFHIARKIDPHVIPGTVNEVIMSRIDRLDEKTRSLLKIASVIGRSFYFRILTHMTEFEGEVENQLSYLEELQLILKQRKMDELAYLFKHALAQEATYESILMKKRKELHLKTARTIEIIFQDKITEFYGILAWHFSKGEDFEKAEEYLVKAGEEALRTSASTEAINYFREALKFYRENLGSEADPGKIAEIEHNIGTALINKGQFGEAIGYMDSVLRYYGIKTHAGKLGTYLTVLSGFAHLLVALYLPSLKWKKVATPEENKLNRLMFRQYHCFGFVESHRIIFSGFQFIRRLTRFDLTKSAQGVDQFINAAYMFTYAGISSRIHHRILNFIKEKVNPDDPVELMSYATHECLGFRMEGRYQLHEYNPELVERSFNVGNLQTASYYIIFSFFIELGRGKFEEAMARIEKLLEMQKLFDNNTIRGWIYLAKSKLLTKKRQLSEALINMEKFLEFCKEVEDKTQLLWAYASKAYIQFLIEDISGAERTFDHIEPEARKSMIYIFRTTVAVTRLSLDLHHLENSIKANNKPEVREWKKKGHKSCGIAIETSKKIADDRVEILRLAGTYFWLAGKKRKAVRWWTKGLIAGREMGALPELARTYLEIGERLQQDKSRKFKIDTMDSEVCLKEADAIFRGLGLNR